MKKRTVIIVIIVILVLLVIPFGQRVRDGGSTYYAPLLIPWYSVHDYSTRGASVPIYPHDGKEHEPPKTKTVYGGIDIYLFGQKIYDSYYQTEVPIDS